METWPTKPPEPWERYLSVACHIAGISFPYLAPIIALIVARGRSKFLSAHALQSLFEALFLTLFLVLVTIVSLCLTLPKVLELIQTRGQSFEWSLIWTTLIKSAIIWIGFGLVSLWYTVQSVIDAITAYRGEWRQSIISGRIARRALKVGPQPLD